ncbi:hypothetical protein [Geodermatophilus maliterrae]|uniref:Uncharacterized protein n=1 Tax=Geodermatophilus maliterrae TaxID=3162531 RepID=A0ABV3X8U2_9ACTN
MEPRAHETSSPLLRALEAAHALGRADGRLAVEIEPAGDPAGEPAAGGAWCHGLAPEDLARLVWDGGAGAVTTGAVPGGVVLNAPLWYAQGFREALACARAQQARGAVDGTRPAEHCRPAASSPPCALVCRALPAPRSGDGH